MINSNKSTFIIVLPERNFDENQFAFDFHNFAYFYLKIWISDTFLLIFGFARNLYNYLYQGYKIIFFIWAEIFSVY